MPDETAIRRIEELLVDITRLGGENERTSIVPNLTVVNAAPTGLTNFITIADDRDGDTILAKTVPGVAYAVNDKVNVLFVEGTEPIAYQQGSESSNAGLWGIVPSTSTDIFYNSGDVGIGKSVAPDASLEILNTAQAQLRLTHTEDTKFADFTLDTNHDLTVKPSSTGQVIVQPTSDSTDFFQVLDAGGGDPVLNVDSTNERVGISTNSPVATLSISPTSSTDELLEISGATTKSLINVISTITPAANPQILRFVPTITPGGAITTVFGANINPSIAGSGSDAITNLILYAAGATAGGSYGGTITNMFSFRATTFVDSSSGTPVVTNHYAFWTQNLTFATNNFGIYQQGTAVRNQLQGDTGIGLLTTPSAQLHVDQPSTTGAQPVALFDQADISEEIFEFVCTIGVGNAIEAIGAKTLTTTHFIKVTIPGGLTRYFPVGTIA